MDLAPSRRHWLMPWLAPLLLGAAYLVELRWEGAATEPAGLLLQVLFGVPLILALSVLLAVGEQELHTRTMTRCVRRWLVWTPRALLLLFVAFLALLSVDVFEPGRSAAEIAIGLLMHNLPTLALLALTVGAWRRPWIGSLGLVAFTGWWLWAFQWSRAFPLSVVLLMAGLPLAVAALLLLNWSLLPPTQPTRA